MRPIDADNLMIALDEGIPVYINDESYMNEGFLVQTISDQPTLTIDDLLPKERAMWIPYYNGGLDRREYRCSKCWNGTPNNQDPRCLDCGSEMLREM